MGSNLLGGNMAPQYQILAWALNHVQIGTLRHQILELNAVGLNLSLSDIRNCSAAFGGHRIAITAVNRQTGKQALWRYELDEERGDILIETDYILNNAIDPSGRYICYTAPPLRTHIDMSLYVYDLQSSHSDLIV